MADWSKVTAEHVRKAIELFERGEELPHLREKARNTFLIANGKEYDGKFIRKLAYRLAIGKEVSPDCNGGMETVNFFKKIGFDSRYTTAEAGGELERTEDQSLRSGRMDENQLVSFLEQYKQSDLLQRLKDPKSGTRAGYEFFQKFGQKKFLEKAQWPDFQEMGKHLNSLVTNALARTRALGKPNHPIEHYRKCFIDLLHGTDDIALRIDRFRENVKYIGRSSISELVGEFFADQYVFYNHQDIQAMEVLGVEMEKKRGDSGGMKFVKYNKAIEPIKQKYLEIVGKQTDLPLGLEIDQFFCFVSRHGNDALLKLFNTFLGEYTKLRSPEGSAKEEWNEGYKWDILPKLKDEIFGSPITAANVVEKANILRRRNPPQGSFVHWSNTQNFEKFAAQHPQETSDLINRLIASEDSVGEAIDEAIEEVDRLNGEHLELGTPFWGYILAASDFAKYSLYKDETFQWLREELGKNKEWKSLTQGEKYSLFRDYCLKIGKLLQERGNLKEFVAEGAAITPGYTALDGQDFLYLSTSQNRLKPSAEKRYWLFAPGRQAHRWDEFYKTGIMAIDFDLERDLSKYQSQEEYIPLLREAKGLDDEVSPTNRARVLYEFTHAMKPGDVVITKRGTSHFLGWGVVTSEYQYDSNRADYRHVRKVEWKNKGEWEKGNLTINLQTLTDITNRDDLPAIKNLLGIDISFPSQRMDLPLNQILYGPPGTGKTYCLSKEYFPLFTDNQSADTGEYFDSLADAASWWVLIGAVLLDLKEAHVADIMDHPLMRAKLRTSPIKTPKQTIWISMQNHTPLESTTVRTNIEKRAEPFIFNKKEDSVWTVDRERIESDAPEVEALLKQYQNPPQTRTEKRYEFITFHQSYSYEEFIEGIRPETDESGNVLYKIRDGIFKRLVTKAKENPSKRYALFIDEINRGNISKIFGELITLIEDDKRLGAENELRVRLPYSGEEFVVPANLHIIGTLNTADRSIALMDIALRRRFEFRKLYPRYDLPDLQYPALLRSLNEQIRRERGPDYQIGHSYFLNRKTPFDLAHVMNQKIIPLLTEYFYDDQDMIRRILQACGVTMNDEDGQLVFASYKENAQG